MLVQQIIALAETLRYSANGEQALLSITVSEAGRMALMQDAELLQHTPQPWLSKGHIEIAGVRVLVDRSTK